MASFNSWLSPNVMHALGWALIHSLWQVLSVAALAAVAMAFSRRPSVRYLVGVGALTVMLAAPIATFFILMRAPVQAPLAANAGEFALPGSGFEIKAHPAALPLAAAPPTAAPSDLPGGIGALANPSRLPPNILPWLVAAWLCGVAFFSLRLAGGFLLLEYRRRKQSRIPNPGMVALCQQVQRQLGLDRAIRYLECGWLQAPAVIGWIRPIVFLPAVALTGLSEEQLRAVIAHELAHIRRLDALVNLSQVLIETLLFYHPAMWWLNRRIRAERELCCDEIAVSLSGNRFDYARALALIAEWEKAPILAMAANRGPLSERILHLLGRKPAGTGQRMIGLTGSVLFLVAALAAANALVEIAALPMAHAKESFKAAMSSTQDMGNRPAQKTLRTGVPPTGNEALDQPNDGRVVSRETKSVLPGQDGTLAQPETLVPPVPDLSGLPRENIATPSLIASLDARAAIPNDPLQPVTPDGSGNPSSASSVPANEQVVMPGTPTGAGDPNATVCRAPQRIAGSGQFGPQICLHNYEWWKVAMNGKDIAPDGETLIDRPTVKNPQGEGDPDAITCRTPQFVSRGPLVKVCRPNRFWADLIKNHEFVDANGVIQKARPGVNYPGWPGFFGNSYDNNYAPYRDSYGVVPDSGQPSQSSAGGTPSTFGGYTPR